MTLRQATIELRSQGITLRKVDGEYQVLPKGTGPAQTYYTNDLGDAYATGLAIAREMRASGQVTEYFNDPAYDPPTGKCGQCGASVASDDPSLCDKHLAEMESAT